METLGEIVVALLFFVTLFLGVMYGVILFRSDMSIIAHGADDRWKCTEQREITQTFPIKYGCSQYTEEASHVESE